MDKHINSISKSGDKIARLRWPQLVGHVGGRNKVGSRHVYAANLIIGLA